MRGEMVLQEVNKIYNKFQKYLSEKFYHPIFENSPNPSNFPWHKRLRAYLIDIQK